MSAALKRRILIGNDEPDITSVISRDLKMEGFDVDTFNDPIDVLVHNSLEICELLLVDIRMPTLAANKA